MENTLNGEIFFDGENIDMYTIDSWHSCLSVVSQNTKIFMGIVADNITMLHSDEINRLSRLYDDYELSCFLESDSLRKYQNSCVDYIIIHFFD